MGDRRRNPYSVCVAPMEGVTTFPTRLWLHLTSRPGAATTPFLRATRTYPEDRLPEMFAPELGPLRGVLPYAVTPQLMACDPEIFLRAAVLLPREANGEPQVVELNCGCPSPNGAGQNAGSGILRDARQFGDTIAGLVSELGPGRLAVKMRVGIDSPEEFDALLAQVAGLPLARLTIHARTRVEKYRGHSRWDLVERAARATETPTWASGDVVGHRSHAQLRLIAPSIAGTMIGRGILHNPWIFEELRTGQPVEATPTTIACALACYAMLHELSISAPTKLLARIESGRIGKPCLLDADAWERLASQLAPMLGAPPFGLRHGSPAAEIPVSPTATARTRQLWAHLRTSLPEDLQSPRVLRSRSVSELLTALLTRPSAAPIRIAADV